LTGYGGYPPRPAGWLPLVRGAFDVARLTEQRREIFTGIRAKADLPFVGITTDGRLRPGLFSIADEGVDIARICAAADDLLDALAPTERDALLQPIDSPLWRIWTNAFPVWSPHGLLLEDLSGERRDAVLGLVSTCLSDRGFADVRACMRLNAALGEIVQDYPDTLTEWLYRFTLFGTPGADEPWGWQLAGHHIDLHCFVLGRQLVLTPMFLGAEPRIADRGRYEGIRAFDAELERGLDLVGALDEGQAQRATLCGSMLSADLPPHLNHPSEGRMRTVAGGDNLVLDYEGLSAADMTDPQRDLLRALVEVYLGRLPEAAHAARTAEVERHLGETYFAWVGSTASDAPFYYKVHSPVLTIELDCHRGIFIANDEPEPFHVHTVVRTPNGNDYGRDLLRQHYERHPHRIR
jgi:hypothetical protein